MTLPGSYRGELQYNDRIHLRNRDYDPQTGTFLTKDPLGVGAEPEGRPTSANLFAYVGNDPLNYIDPLGLCRVQDGDFSIDGPTCEEEAGAQCAAEGGTHIYAPTGECLNLGGGPIGLCPGLATDAAGLYGYGGFVRAGAQAYHGQYDDAGNTVAASLGTSALWEFDAFGLGAISGQLPPPVGLGTTEGEALLARGGRWASVNWAAMTIATAYDIGCEATGTTEFQMGWHELGETVTVNNIVDGTGRIASWLNPCG